MKGKILNAIGPLALVAAVGSAHAANVLPTTTTDGSDLVLFVTDGTSGNYFTYDTGVTLDSLRSFAQINADGVQLTSIGSLLTPTFSSAVTSALSTFLNTETVDGDTITWTIAAGDTSTKTVGGSSGGNVVGQTRYLVSSSTILDGTTALVGALTNTKVRTVAGTTSATGLSTFFNTELANATLTNNFSTSDGWGKGAPGIDQPNANNQYGAAYTETALISGTPTSAQLYEFATNSLTAGNRSNVYETSNALVLTWTRGGQATLAVAAVSAVPLPAAVWLFGSGLLGLFGIGRRKSATV